MSQFEGTTSACLATHREGRGAKAPAERTVCRYGYNAF